jgi:hypothetical protein
MSLPKHHYSGSETRERDVFATIVETDTSSILTARIRVEIPNGCLDWKQETIRVATKELAQAIDVVFRESRRLDTDADAAAADYEGRSSAPSQGV